MICTELDQPHIMSVAILLASYSLDLRLGLELRGVFCGGFVLTGFQFFGQVPPRFRHLQ